MAVTAGSRELALFSQTAVLKPEDAECVAITMNHELSERAGTLLRTLVDMHIRDGQPVGSRVLGERAGLPVSPATVRNTMSELEERGYLQSPHTSAGRIPTAQGYRFFVDCVLQAGEDLDRGAAEILKSELNTDANASDLVQSATNLLSSVTMQAGVVTVPKSTSQPLRQVEFLPLSGDRVLVILVTNQRDVQNRIIHTRRVFSEEELKVAAEQINQQFFGRELGDIQQALSRDLALAQGSIDDFLSAKIDLARQALSDDEAAPDCLVVGKTQLLAGASPEELDRLRELFAALKRKQDLLHLFERCADADGVRIFIGEEAGFQAFDDYSIVTAPYGDGARPLGMLGVIGPTRMAYDRVIPVVDMTSRLLSAALRI
ncbi:MAG: heat-inducible transcriptional repressor HrcA [Pseudomonadota bacterium]